MTTRVSEDWQPEDLDALLAMAMTAVQESKRCHDANAPHAALLMLAVSFEAALLGLIVAHVPDHETEKHPKHPWAVAPSHLHLADLTKVAVEMGWLTESARTKVDAVLIPARTMVAHPGAYVRGLRQVPELDLGDPVGYVDVLGIVEESCAALAAALPSL